MIVYFSYHALSGDQSVLKWSTYRHAEAEFRVELSQLQQRAAVLEKQNQMLRDRSLDLDYLDERVRAKLHYIHPDDRIIITANVHQTPF
ncbi:MAG: septum formation initiator family protein [Robiginitomaculum sp.]|nr:septum formation initiator family protein [Robiginitomaculum sp.]